jgi:hypothetical protein
VDMLRKRLHMHHRHSSPRSSLSGFGACRHFPRLTGGCSLSMIAARHPLRRRESSWQLPRSQFKSPSLPTPNACAHNSSRPKRSLKAATLSSLTRPVSPGKSDPLCWDMDRWLLRTLAMDIKNAGQGAASGNAIVHCVLAGIDVSPVATLSAMERSSAH